MMNFKSSIFLISAKKSRGNIYEDIHSNVAQFIELKSGRKENSDESIIKKHIHAKDLNTGGTTGISNKPFFTT